jgi:hypothetical protein
VRNGSMARSHGIERCDSRIYQADCGSRCDASKSTLTMNVCHDSYGLLMAHGFDEQRLRGQAGFNAKFWRRGTVTSVSRVAGKAWQGMD